MILSATDLITWSPTQAAAVCEAYRGQDAGSQGAEGLHEYKDPRTPVSDISLKLCRLSPAKVPPSMHVQLVIPQSTACDLATSHRGWQLDRPRLFWQRPG